jgi:hypothetical protein
MEHIMSAWGKRMRRALTFQVVLMCPFYEGVTTAATASRPTILGRFANRITFWDKKEYADFRIFMGNLGSHTLN